MSAFHCSTAPTDFDFIIGTWQVRHRRLNARLVGCSEWTEFLGTSSTRKILDGFGNVEDNVLYFPDGEVKAAAFRSFDPQQQKWAIWWLDGRAPHSLDVPVVGSFEGSVGTFFASDRTVLPPKRSRRCVLRTWSGDLKARVEESGTPTCAHSCVRWNNTWRFLSGIMPFGDTSLITVIY